MKEVYVVGYWVTQEQGSISPFAILAIFEEEDTAQEYANRIKIGVFSDLEIYVMPQTVY